MAQKSKRSNFKKPLQMPRSFNIFMNERLSIAFELFSYQRTTKFEILAGSCNAKARVISIIFKNVGIFLYRTKKERPFFVLCKHMLS